MIIKIRKKDHKKEKNHLQLKKPLPKQRRVVKHLKTYKEYIMDVINKCNSLNFCPARSTCMPAMSLVQKHCPMMSFYLGRQRDNECEFNLCMQDLLNIVQSKKRQSLADSSQSTRSNTCLCLLSRRNMPQKLPN